MDSICAQQPCIILSRHGESEYMLKQLLGGNPPLTSKGQAYAQQLPQLILPLVLSPQAPVSVLTSTLQRTIQTAAHLPFAQQRLSALDEINAGICEHMSYEQVAQAYPAVAQARAADKLGYRYPEGESYLDLVQRLWPVVHQLERRSSHVVVVAHQAVLRVLVGLLLRKPLQEMPRMSIPLHTVMQLTPAATEPGSSPYDMTLIQPAQVQDLAAGAQHAGVEADVSSSSTRSSQSSSSCDVQPEQSRAMQAWSARVWPNSCLTQAHGLHPTPAAVLEGQHA